MPKSMVVKQWWLTVNVLMKAVASENQCQQANSRLSLSTLKWSRLERRVHTGNLHELHVRGQHLGQWSTDQIARAFVKRIVSIAKFSWSWVSLFIPLPTFTMISRTVASKVPVSTAVHNLIADQSNFEVDKMKRASHCLEHRWNTLVYLDRALECNTGRSVWHWRHLLDGESSHEPK